MEFGWRNSRWALRGLVLHCAAIAIGSVASSPAYTGEYSIAKVTDLEPQIATTSYPVPSINNTGRIAFFGNPPTLGHGLYIGDAMGLARVVEGSLLLGAPTINNADEVAFWGYPFLGSSFGLYRASAANVTQLPTPNGAFNVPALADDGTVTYGLTQSSQPRTQWMLHSNGGPATVLDELVGSNIFFSPAAGYGHVSVSDAGIVAYSWKLEGNSSYELVRIMNGQREVLFSHSGFDYPRFAENTVVVNDSGIVAFAATMTPASLPNGPVDGGIYLADGLSLTQIVDANLLTPTSVDGGLSINNYGEIAFLAGWQQDGEYRTGLYTGPDRVQDRIIQVGDILDGSVVTKIRFGKTGLNDSGQLAFEVEFNDGRAGVFTATRVVPEASSIVLAGIAMLCLTTWRFRRSWRMDKLPRCRVPFIARAARLRSPILKPPQEYPQHAR